MNKIELLKSVSISKKTGKKFVNLYLRVNGGSPILIDCIFPSGKFNGKIRGLLLAVATECNISNVVVVSPADAKVDC